MNDELQRRLRAADPLTAGNGANRTPVYLEGLKENAMKSDMKEKPIAPRFAGVAALTAVALAGTIIVGGLLGPERALAFSANATLATEAQLAVADAACKEPIEGAADAELDLDSLELKSLELFGNGGVAIFSSETTTGYCMVLVDGDSAQAGIRIFGATSEFQEFIGSAGSTEFQGETLSIIVGYAPGAASVEVVGLDGVVATVIDDLYGLWLPQSFADEAFELVARDSGGNEIQRQALPWGKSELPSEVPSEVPSPTR